MIGYGGGDTLSGGSDNDIFRFVDVNDSRLSDPDTIVDFAVKRDKIDLQFIDANEMLAGDQAFTLVATFSGAAGELRVWSDGTRTFVGGNTQGAQTNMLIQINDAKVLTAKDFVF